MRLGSSGLIRLREEAKCGERFYFYYSIHASVARCTAVIEERGGILSSGEMTVPKAPNATLSNLQRADGSATYICNGYSVIGAVNGPIEVQRRDELPEEAAIDVVVRPAAGVGGL